MTIKDKLGLFRSEMKNHNLAAYIIPSSDAHISEYTADCWKSIEWISGFTGEAATVVITETSANLWVDSRFFIQAEKQIAGTEFILHKLKMPGVKDFPDWIMENISSATMIGIDGYVFQVNAAKNLERLLKQKNIVLAYEFDIPGKLWEFRPEIPTNKIFLQDEKYSGASAENKIGQVRQKMQAAGADVHIIATLDDTAWILNIRGKDIECNPTPIAYSAIEHDKALLFITETKVPSEVRRYLESSGVEIHDYYQIENYIKSLDDVKLLLDPARMNYKLYKNVNDSVKIIEQMNPSTKLKAVKNAVEIKGMKAALLRDGAAMVKFFHWLENSIGKEIISEVSAAEKMKDFRAESNMYLGESFETISAYKANGAIVHYVANEENNATLEPDGFFLTDSGGQYYDGTTDITRMIHLSEPTEIEKLDYTNILRGVIELSMAKFPKNTRGAQLDVLARQYIWKNSQNYMHGTGHGVGCFLNVHEGPQSIRMEENPIILEPGMMITNEPGLYKENQYGVRIENIIMVAEDITSEFGDFFKFETLTLCPIDLKAVNLNLMSGEQIKWLNDYHLRVREELEPLLEGELKEYLYEKTRAI
ncbi:MAG: aminopeptidase P family protein [bacterium]